MDKRKKKKQGGGDSGGDGGGDDGGDSVRGTIVQICSLATCPSYSWHCTFPVPSLESFPTLFSTSFWHTLGAPPLSPALAPVPQPGTPAPSPRRPLKGGHNIRRGQLRSHRKLSFKSLAKPSHDPPWHLIPGTLSSGPPDTLCAE